MIPQERFPWRAALAAVGVSYGTYLFILRAAFWDDWTIIGVRPVVILNTFREAGSFLNLSGYLHVGLQAFDPGAYRLLVIGLIVATGWLVWNILGTLPWGRAAGRSTVAILFMVLPLNSSRFAYITFPGTFCVFLFFLAWYLAVVRRGLAATVAAAVLFMLSFNLNSLVLFAFLPLLQLSVQSLIGTDRQWWWRAARISPLVLCPVVFWGVRAQFFAPYGAYNAIDLAYLLAAAPWVVAGAVYAIFATWFVSRGGPPRRQALVLLPVAIWVLWLGSVPYEAVGKGLFRGLTVGKWYASFFDWNMRFQALLPLGAALTVAVMDRALRVGARSWLAAFIVGVSVCANIYLALEYRLDWRKQQEVIALWAASPELKHARTILVRDHAVSFNARRRVIRPYEYTGWLWRAFGDETRFAMDVRLWSGPYTNSATLGLSRMALEAHHASAYLAGPVDAVVDIHASSWHVAALWTGRPGMMMTVTRPAR